MDTKAILTPQIILVSLHKFCPDSPLLFAGVLQEKQTPPLIEHKTQQQAFHCRHGRSDGQVLPPAVPLLSAQVS